MKIFMFGFSVLVYVTNLFAAPAPYQSEKLLWNVDGFNKPREARHICMYNKSAPQTLVLCLGEVVKSSGDSEGFIVRKSATNEILGTFRIIEGSKWTHLYRTSEYVANTDFYSRTLTIVDKTNRKAVLTEVFAYSDEADHSTKHILTRSLSGALPDGSRVNLDSGFFFN